MGALKIASGNQKFPGERARRISGKLSVVYHFEGTAAKQNVTFIVGRATRTNPCPETVTLLNKELILHSCHSQANCFNPGLDKELFINYVPP